MKNIIIVGAGLSGLTAAFRLKQAGYQVQVLEAGNTPGGRCATIRRDGFIIDTGPEIVAGSYQSYLRLVNDVGLASLVTPSSPVVGTVRDGKVIDNDTTKLSAMAMTPLLSLKAKCRLMWGLLKVWGLVKTLDAYTMADHAQHDDFFVNADEKARKLFGDEATDYLIDPLVRMIGGSEPKRISQLMMLGGLNSWSASLCNIQGGLDLVPKAVARNLDVLYNARVSDVEETEKGVSIRYVDGNGDQHSLEADRCVLACQMDVAMEIAPSIESYCRTFLENMNFCKLIDIKVAYGAPTRSKAFACQVPSKESRELLMYGLTHNKVPDRAPANHSLFTLYTDDLAFDDLAEKSDDDLIAWAREEMEKLYPEIQGSYLFGYVNRYAKAGYRGEPGFFQRLSWLLEKMPKDSHIQLGGDVFGAGSMEAAVLWGERAAGRLMASDF
jgi:protoporphyrinogen/coproporphyrinogen III oxidase